MTVTDLTRELLAVRFRPRHEQPALLLGKACAREAGKPYQQVVQKALGQLGSYISSLGFSADSISTALLPVLQHAAANAEGVPAKLLAAIPESMRASVEQSLYRLLRQYYMELPVPLFYQDLASLLKAGTFSRVLTTNYDNLLEQALSAPPSPLRRDRDYFVVNVPTMDRHDLKHQLEEVNEDSLLVLKMHGDLMDEGSDFDLARVEGALVEHRKAMYGLLSNNVVVVGYERESAGVDKALRAQSGGVIWWVSDSGMDPGLASDLTPVRTVNVVQGPGCSPHEIFGTLLTVLARAPGVVTVAGPSNLASVAAQADAEFTIENLQPIMLTDRLARAQDELERLRQSAPPRSNPDVEAQIAYQKRQIAEIEDQIRLQNKDQILSLLAQFSIPGGDPEVVKFLDEQKKVIMTQFSATVPNQDLISAAISAITVSAGRLGKSVAPLDAADALSAFVPSAIGRGM